MTDEIYPRQLSLEPISFKDIPNDIAVRIEHDIQEFNSFVAHMGLIKGKNFNFLSAIKKAMNMQLYRIIGIDFDDSSPPGIYTNPKTMYDAGYLIGCLTQHATFFVVMDDFEFPYENWNLLNINKNTVHIIVFSNRDDQVKKLVLMLKNVKKVAKNNGWNGNVKITASFNVRI